MAAKKPWLYPYIIEGQALDELVEITDSHDRPFLLMEKSWAEQAALPRRIVLACLKDKAGRLFLPQRSTQVSKFPCMWDISCMEVVRAGESREDAVLRSLSKNLGLEQVRVRMVSALPYQDNQGTNLAASFFVAGPSRQEPKLNPEFAQDGMFLDEDEVRALVMQMPELVTPELAWATRSGWIFFAGTGAESEQES